MIFPVILCGGSGTRLWPLSRSSYPKQFVQFEKGRTLFKDTVNRAKKIKNSSEPIIICNDAQRFYAKANLLECGVDGTIIVEPVAKNTAPAIALGALFAEQLDANSVLVVMPSDHAILEEDRFAELLSEAIQLAEKDFLVTLGITPTHPATGFGYIETGSQLDNASFTIKRFVEKPTLSKAEEMLQSGNYLWNSGIFVFKASTYLSELKKFEKEMFEACEQTWTNRRIINEFCFLDKNAFNTCPSNSIDYAVMERTQKGAVVPLPIKWNDLGAWSAFYDIGLKDKDNNVTKGDVLAVDTHNSYIHSTGRLVSTIGLDNIAVIETKDSVFVSPLSRVQETKNIVERLKKENRSEAVLHPLVYRPWGSYEGLAHGDRFQVKRIIVQPGEQLSLQLHYHRAEHWIVVEGTAEVQIGDKKELLTENQSTFIPVGSVHRLRNPGKLPLVLIEVQSGSYLGEDDIVRLQDDYKRV